jgi:hypothetical protein
MPNTGKIPTFLVFCGSFLTFKTNLASKQIFFFPSSSSLWSQKSVRGLQVNISTIKPFLILNSFRENVSSALGKKYEIF